MDGLGRAYDKIFIERLWRTVKYEEVYLKEYDDIRDAKDNLRRYFNFYNTDRPHQSLGYRTTEEIYYRRNFHFFEAGKELMTTPVTIINNVLLNESLHHAPSERIYKSFTP